MSDIIYNSHPEPVVRVETQYFHFDDELPLESGQVLAPLTLAYQTYGTLSPSGDNAILLFHALTGDAHAAGQHVEAERTPWWDEMVGAGKAFDTERFYIVCSNIIGGCMGSTGPKSINPKTNEPYATDFPIITIGDMVHAQHLLMEHLGIERWYAIAGGSMGGMQALEWTLEYPEQVERCIAIATTHRLSSQSIAFDAVGRTAIMRDTNWRGGRYYGFQPPANGLSVARMIGHITYLSEQSMHEKFGRSLRDADVYNWGFEPEFSVETYLEYRGDSFVKRFDANSYLYITKAMDYFDISARAEGSLMKAMSSVQARFLLISYSSDWLFPTVQSKEIVRALSLNGKDVSSLEIDSPYGHDAFLKEFAENRKIITGFLK